jgi:hypothetical protein
MPACKECRSFFSIPEEYPDYEPGKGDCVLEKSDSKGKWWTAKPVMGDMDASKCPNFRAK